MRLPSLNRVDHDLGIMIDAIQFWGGWVGMSAAAAPCPAGGWGGSAGRADGGRGGRDGAITPAAGLPGGLDTGGGRSGSAEGSGSRTNTLSANSDWGMSVFNAMISPSEWR